MKTLVSTILGALTLVAVIWVAVGCGLDTQKQGGLMLQSGSATMPKIWEFTPSPRCLQPNQQSDLYWEVSDNTKTVTITADYADSNLPVTVNVIDTAPYGTVIVKPTQDAVYTLTAENDEGSVSEIALVTLRASSGAAQIVANPACVEPGDTAVLRYNVCNMQFCGTNIFPSSGGYFVPHYFANCGGSCFYGDEPVQPAATTTYRLEGQYPPAYTTVWVDPPKINSFSAVAQFGQCLDPTNNKVLLTWDVGNAETMTITAEYEVSGTTEMETIVDLQKADSDINVSEPTGSRDHYAKGNTTYTCTVTNPCGPDTKTVKVGVEGDGPFAWLEADKLCVDKNGTVTLKWARCNCDTWSYNFWGLVGTPQEIGQADVTVSQTSKYWEMCNLNNKGERAYATVWVGKPTINAFDCADAPCKCMKPGQDITLHLDVTNAEKVTITADNGPDPDVADQLQTLWNDGDWNPNAVGPQAVKYNTSYSGNVTFTPGATGGITYLLTAENPCGSVPAQVEVIVTDQPIVQFGIGQEYASTACVDQNGAATLYWDARCYHTIDGLVIGNTSTSVVLKPGNKGSKQVTPAATTIYNYEVNQEPHYATVFVGDPTVTVDSSVGDAAFQPVQCGQAITVPQGQKLCLHLNVTNASDVTINPLPDPDIASQVQQFWDGTSLTGDVCFIPTSSGSYTVIATNPCGTPAECTITVQVEPPPEAPNIENFYTICKSQAGSPCCIPEGWHPCFYWKVYNTKTIDIKVDGVSLNLDPNTVPGILNPVDGQLYSYCHTQALAVGSYTVTFTAKNSVGETTATQTIMVKPPPSIQPDCSSFSTEVIKGGSVTLNATVTNASYYYLTQINMGMVHAGSFNSSPDNLYYTWKPTGSAGDTIHYVLELDNDCGAPYLCYFTVKILEPPPPPVPELSVGDGYCTPDCNPVCFEWCAPNADTVTFTVKASGSNQTVFESPSLPVTDCPPDKNKYYPTLDTPGEYTVTMTATGIGGTVTTSPQTFKVVLQPSIVGGCPIQLILNKPKTSVQLSVQVKNAVSWSLTDKDDKLVDSSPLSLPLDNVTTDLSPQTTTLYFLILTNECDCSSAPCLVDVKVNEPPPLVTLSAKKYCLTRVKDACSSSIDPCCSLPGAVCATLSWVITGAVEAEAELTATPPCSSTAQPIKSYSVGSGTATYGPITVCLSEDTTYTLIVTNKDGSHGTGTVTLKVRDYPNISLVEPPTVTGGPPCAVAGTPLEIKWDAPAAEQVDITVSCFDASFATIGKDFDETFYPPQNHTEVVTPDKEALCHLCATATNECGVQDNTYLWVEVKAVCGPPVISLKPTYPCCKTIELKWPWGGVLTLSTVELSGSVTGATEYSIVTCCNGNCATIATGSGLDPSFTYDDIKVTTVLLCPSCTYELHAIGPGGESNTKVLMVCPCPPAPTISFKGTPVGQVQGCGPGQPWQLDWEVITQTPKGVDWKPWVEIVLQCKDDTGSWVTVSKVGKFYGPNGSTKFDLPNTFDCSKECRFLLTAENCGGLTAEAVVSITGAQVVGAICPEGCICLTKNQAANPSIPYAYSVACQGQPCVCSDVPCGGTAQEREYCYKECPEGCKCLSDTEAKASGLTNSDLCVEQPCGYDSSGNPTKHCYRVTRPAGVCPEGCLCLRPEQARDCGLTDSDWYTEAPCSESGQPIKHCYDICPGDCECLTEDEAREQNYTNLCHQCTCNKPGEPTKYCFSRCTEDCYCLTEKEAADKGYTVSCGEEICDPSGTEPKYCFRPPLKPCSEECECLTDTQAKEYGYTASSQCQMIPCELDRAGKDMYCYPKLAPPVVQLTADRTFVTRGNPVNVCWDVAGEGITEVLFTAAGEKPTPVDPQGCKTFRPTQQTRYLVTAKSAAGSGQDAVTVGVGQPPPVEACPTITSFTTNCPPVVDRKGGEVWAQPCTVSWSVTGPAGTLVSISGIGTVGMSGSTQVQRGATYTLMARYGTCVKTATVQVPR